MLHPDRKNVPVIRIFRRPSRSLFYLKNVPTATTLIQYVRILSNRFAFLDVSYNNGKLCTFLCSLIQIINIKLLIGIHYLYFCTKPYCLETLSTLSIASLIELSLKYRQNVLFNLLKKKLTLYKSL